MPIKMPETLSPQDVVKELDKYIIGQAQAKRAVAIALRNRWRRLQVEGDMREEISPKNILLIGPTGVGKTEIARRLAKLSRAPFLKVEASKFTEVGYVGRDVESMIRDLMEVGVKLVREEFTKNIQERARREAEDAVAACIADSRGEKFDEMTQDQKDELLELLRSGALDDRNIEIEMIEKSEVQFDIFAPMGNGNREQDESFSEFLQKLAPQKKVSKRIPVAEALRQIQSDAEDNLIDKEAIEREAIQRVEQMGIIFIDEIDKIAVSGGNSGGGGHSPDVSREGVQRDLLPIIEGSSVKTKCGFIKTDHILFIASGAFHVSKPSDLIPELQGRFPIRVTLDKLTEDDFCRILTEPHNNLIKQYQMLLKAEDVTVDVTEDAVRSMANSAFRANEKMQNIGARRLHTVIERVFDDISFEASENHGKHYTIDAQYVQSHLGDLIEDVDMRKYIL